MRRSLFLLTLAVVFAVPLVGYTQPTPPRVKRIFQADSVRVAGIAGVWQMHYLEVNALENPWVEVTDPYGGRIRIPAMAYLAISSDLIAFVEGTMARSVFFVQRSLAIPGGVIFLVGLATVVAFPFVVYRRRLRHERESRRHLDDIHRQLAEGREAERLRLAQDLHDGPIQDLHALRMRLSMLTRVPTVSAEAPVAESEAIDEVVEEIQRVIRSLRGVSEDLRPPTLGPFGLAAALRTFAERFQQAHPSLHIDLDLADDGQTLPERVRLALFRIAQEAMNNAAKHGAPSRIDVVLRLDDDHILLQVSDNGQGYDVPDDFRLLGKDGHYGLLGMRERAAFIGADLHIESHPRTDEPTQVRVVARRGAAEWQTPSMMSKV